MSEIEHKIKILELEIQRLNLRVDSQALEIQQLKQGQERQHPPLSVPSTPTMAPPGDLWVGPRTGQGWTTYGLNTQGALGQLGTGQASATAALLGVRT